MNIENLKQIKLLMEYKTSLTRDENLEAIKSFNPSVILEVGDEIVTKVLGGATKGEIDNIISSMSTKLQTVDGVVVGSAKQLDDVIKKAVKAGKVPFTPQMLGTLRSSLLRSPNVSLASKSTAIDDLINGKSFQKLYGNSSYDDIVKGMKKTGNAYPDDVAEEIAKRHTAKTGVKPATGKSGTGKSGTGKPGTGKSGTGKSGTGKSGTGKGKKGKSPKNNKKFVSGWQKFKNSKWATISKWALGIGVSLAGLWYFMKESGGPIPPDFPPIPPEDNDDQQQQDSGPRTSKYTSCPETFPIVQFCKNETIRKVQACLGMPAKYQTSNFGPITQKYLEGKGLPGTEITQNTIDKVCGTQTTQPVQQTPFADDEEEELATVTNSSSNVSSTNVVDDAEEA